MEIKNKTKNIVLIGEGSKGHHLAFLQQFCNSLIRLGHNVVVLTPSIENFNGIIHPKAILVERGSIDSILPSSELNRIIHISKHWYSIRKKIVRIESTLNFKVDLVFFSWLDSYLTNKFPYFIMPLIFPYPWSGLYFHPNHIRLTPIPQISMGSKDSILLAKNCKGIGFHDEYVVKIFKGFKIKSIFFPEIADFTSPNLEHIYYNSIKSKAKNKMVFGVIGPEYRKNALFLVRLAIHFKDDERFLFVFAGNWNLEGYTESEKNEIRLFLEEPISNTIIFNEYIMEGEAINSLINALDVVFIIYKNFLSTSNYSTKSAFLKKLVISSNRFIIGEETDKYDLGVLVDENNFHQLIEAVEITNRDYEILKSKAKFDEYLKKHSLVELDKSFASII